MKYEKLIILVLMSVISVSNSDEVFGQSVWQKLKEAANVLTESGDDTGGSAVKRKGMTVKLTGTARENITLKFADGTTETITSFPYEFKVEKSTLPMTVELESPNYSYSPITIVKKPQGGIGQIYTVHSRQKTMSEVAAVPQVQTVVVQKEVSAVPEKKTQVDWSQAINKAPQVSRKAENTYYCK